MTITFKQLQVLFEKPINEASLLLGVGVTKLKSICRSYGIKRWPWRKVQSMQQRLKELQVKRDSGKGDLLHVQREYESVDKSLHGLLNGDMPASLAILNQQGSGKKASKPTMKRTLDVAQESDDAAASVAADEAATLELLLAIEQTVVAAEQQQQQQMMLENGPLAKKPRLTL